MKNKNLDIIQVYRGIAALMVAIFHFWIHMSHFFNDSFSSIRFITSIGAFGVDFFFVLSGFIISFSYVNKEITIKKYLSNRYLRIFLPYIPLGIIFGLGYTFFPNLSFEGVSFNWFATLTLIPVGTTSLVVAWSLMHEILFYFIFIIAIINYKKYNYFLIIWSFLIIIYNYFLQKNLIDSEILNLTSIDSLDFFISKFFHLYNFEFILGYICYLSLDYFKNKKFTIFLAVFLFIGFVISYYLDLHFIILKTLYSLFSFWLIIIAYQYKDIIISKNNFFMKMGNYSYSLYLLHIPIQIVFFRIFPHFNVWVTFFVGIFLLLFCSFIYSEIFEKKLLFYFKSKLKI
jgi:exopolysaccharide production protein ExoZ